MRSALSWLLLMAFIAVSGRTLAHPDQSHSPEDKVLPPQAEGFWFGHPGKASDVTRTIRITAMTDRFLPSIVNIEAGQTVRFDIFNPSAINHEFVIGDVAEQQAHDKEMAAMPNMPVDDPNGVSIAIGKTATLIWTFTRPGTLQYACHLPGHYAAGMFGQLNVLEPVRKNDHHHV